MPENVEIKAACRDLTVCRRLALGLGARPHAVEMQTDRYFELDGRRRIKLRTIEGGRAEMIEYDRPEEEGVRLSRYRVDRVRSDDGLCLVPKGEPLVIVRKRREILLLDNVRIHLDDVQGLGSFVELEAVVDASHDEARCRAQVDEIMAGLAIDADDLIRASYSDLLKGREP